MQQWFVVTGLKLVGDDQKAVRVLLHLVRYLAAGKPVQSRFGDLLAAVLMFAGKGHDGFVGALALLEIALEGVEILDGPLDTVSDDHGPGLTTDLAVADYLGVEVVHHDLGLFADGVLVGFHIAAQLFLGFLGVEERIILNSLGQAVIALHWGIVLQHIEDETLLDCLLHRVAVERVVLHRAVGLRVRLAENLQGLVLGGRGEGEVAGVGHHLPAYHDLVDFILERFFFLTVLGMLFQYAVHGSGGLAALTGMRLVDDDGELALAVFVADLIENERELLHRGDDDLLPGLEEFPQIARVFGMADSGGDLGELLDGVADLLVENPPVGDNDDRIEQRLALVLQPHKLVRQPGNGVALSTARRVLDQVAPTDTNFSGIGQQHAHHRQLVIAGEDLLVPLFAGFLVLFLHHLGVVFQDVCKARFGEGLLP